MKIQQPEAKFKPILLTIEKASEAQALCNLVVFSSYAFPDGSKERKLAVEIRNAFTERLHVPAAGKATG